MRSATCPSARETAAVAALHPNRRRARTFAIMTAPEIATWVLRTGTAYAAIGIAFAVYLLVRGLARFDAAAAHASWGFKLLIVPGAVALWPLLWRRVRAGGPAAERNAHDRAAARAGR